MKQRLISMGVTPTFLLLNGYLYPIGRVRANAPTGRDAANRGRKTSTRHDWFIGRQWCNRNGSLHTRRRPNHAHG